MEKYIVTKENTEKVIKENVKARLYKDFMEFLAMKYDEDSVSMVRIGSSTSKKNLPAFIWGEVEDDGFIADGVATLEITMKPWKDKKTAKTETVAFDFQSARQAYEDYLKEKARKEAERKTNSGKAKTKSKKEKDAEKAERMKEIEEAQRKAKEKLDRQTAEIRAKQKEG